MTLDKFVPPTVMSTWFLL